jgi:hypothetical protein
MIVAPRDAFHPVNRPEQPFTLHPPSEALT